MPMYIGRLSNAFVCFISGLSGLSVFYFLQKKRKKEKIDYSQGLDYFSFLLGLLWFFIGIGTFLTWLGHPEYHTFLYQWVIGPLTYIHLLPAFRYFAWSFFHDEKKKIRFNLFFSLMALASLATHFYYKFTPIGVTYWGTKHKLNAITSIIFLVGLFIPGFICILVELKKRYREWKKIGGLREKQLLGFSLGFLAYAVTGFFETLIFTKGWLILLGRIGIMMGPLTFYFFATQESRE